MKIYLKFIMIVMTMFWLLTFCSCSDSKPNLFKAADLPNKKMTLIGETVGGITNRVLVCYTIDNGVKLKQIYNLNTPYRERSKIQAYSSYSPVIRVGKNGKYFYASTMDKFYAFSCSNPSTPRIITLKDLKFRQEENSFGNYIICQNKVFMELRNFANRPSQVCEFDLSKSPTSAILKSSFHSDFDSGNIIIENNKSKGFIGRIHYLYTPACKKRLPFSAFKPSGIRIKLQDRQECVDFLPEYGWLFSKSTVVDQTINDDIYFVEKGIDLKRTKTLIGSYIRNDGEIYHTDGKKFYSDKYKMIGKGLLAHWGYKGRIYYLYKNKVYRYSLKEMQEEVIHKWSAKTEISEFPIFSLDRKILAVLTSSKRKTVLYFFDLENETYSSLQTPSSLSNVMFIANAAKDEK